MEAARRGGQNVLISGALALRRRWLMDRSGQVRNALTPPTLVLLYSRNDVHEWPSPKPDNQFALTKMSGNVWFRALMGSFAMLASRRRADTI